MLPVRQDAPDVWIYLVARAGLDHWYRTRPGYARVPFPVGWQGPEVNGAELKVGPLYTSGVEGVCHDFSLDG